MTEHEQDVTIEEFCKTHNACKDGWNWAIANCKTMAECWEKLPSDYLVWTATRVGVLSDKELRLFAVFCCREIWNLLDDKRSRKAVEVVEKFANGQATKEELQVAAAAAYAAHAADAADASRAAAYAADAADASRAAADATYAADAAYAVYASRVAADAACAAAYAASRVAADAACAAADDDAAYAAARQKQANWLRGTIPNFKRTAKNDRD